MEPIEIIRALGGGTKLAARLGIENPQRVYNWGQRGIASRFWFDILEIAREQGRTDITIDILRQSHDHKAA